MPNRLFAACAKLVYSLRKLQGKSRGLLYTGTRAQISYSQNPMDKHSVSPTVIPALYPLLSTVKNLKLPPIIHRLYTVST